VPLALTGGIGPASTFNPTGLSISVMSAGRLRRVVARGRRRRDLVAATGLVVAAALAAVAPVVRSSPVRAGLGLVLALVLPGYAVVAALFPVGTDETDTLDAVERLGLAVGASVAISVCWGVLLSATVGLSADWVVGGLSVVTVAGVAAALVRDDGRQTGGAGGRRRRTSPPEWSLEGGRLPRLRTGSLVAVLVVSLVASGVLLSGVPRPAPTEVYLSDDPTGEGSAIDGAPTEFVAGEPRPVPVTIVNHAPESRSYTVVYVVQEVEPGTRTRAAPLNVTAERELGRVTREVPGGEATVVDRALAPSVSRVPLRLVVRVYRDDPTVTAPTQTVHVWVEVAADDGRVAPPPGTERGERR